MCVKISSRCNLSVYVCEDFFWRLKFWPLPLTPVNQLYLWNDHCIKGAWWFFDGIIVKLLFKLYFYLYLLIIHKKIYFINLMSLTNHNIWIRFFMVQYKFNTIKSKNIRVSNNLKFKKLCGILYIFRSMR